MQKIDLYFKFTTTTTTTTNNNNNIYLKSNIHCIIRYKFSGLYNGIRHGIHIKTVQCI